MATHSVKICVPLDLEQNFFCLSVILTVIINVGYDNIDVMEKDLNFIKHFKCILFKYSFICIAIGLDEPLAKMQEEENKREIRSIFKDGYEREVIDIFQMLDKDSNGGFYNWELNQILKELLVDDVTELKLILKDFLTDDVTGKDIDELIEYADIDESGFIDSDGMYSAAYTSIPTAKYMMS